MQSFTDTSGRTWKIEVTTGVIRRVKQQTGIDLTNLQSLSEELSEVCSFVDVLESLLEPQLTQLGMTINEVCDCMLEEQSEAASLAILHAVIDFFPPSKGEPLRASLQNVQRTKTRMVEKASAEMMTQVNSPKFQEAIENALMSGNSSGNSLDLSA